MFDHAPADYPCPFCRLLAGADGPLSTQRDIVARTPDAAALISPRWWPRNHGHVLVVPTAHHENLYTLPVRCGHAVVDLTRRVAVAMRRSYGCAGVSTRQHNEPAGGQDVWHFHQHVFPRYPGDDLYASPPEPDWVPGPRRWRYADRLRDYLTEPPETPPSM